MLIFDEIDKLCNSVSNSDNSISSNESDEECDMELNPVWHDVTSDTPFTGDCTIKYIFVLDTKTN